MLKERVMDESVTCQTSPRCADTNRIGNGEYRIQAEREDEERAEEVGCVLCIVWWLRMEIEW